MEDTQRSQPISPYNQEIAERAVLNSGKFYNPDGEGPPILRGHSSLVWIKELARDEPEMVFTSLAHRIDFSLLKQSFRQVRRSKSCGVDKMTAKKYALNLDMNLHGGDDRGRCCFIDLRFYVILVEEWIVGK